MVFEPGEELFFRCHPSWRAIVGFYLRWVMVSLVIGILAGLASAFPSGRVHPDWVVVAVLGVFALTLARGALRQRRTTYVLTSRRLAVETGRLSRRRHETPLEHVQDVRIRQSIRERLLRVGTVEFETVGGYRLRFRGIDDPRWIVRTVDLALQERR